jgi:hypothetical protein
MEAIFTPTPLDPSVFEDELAYETEWTPLKSGGTNFRTQVLVQVSPVRFVYRSSLGAKAFSGLFILIGALVTLFGIIGNRLFHFENYWLLLVVGGIFILGGSFMLRWMSRRIVFDCGIEKFWKDHREPRDIPLGKEKDLISFDEIRALQLIRERISSSKRSYYSYEFNLVLNDGSRLNVLDHGSGNHLLYEMAFLSLAIDKPLWSALDPRYPTLPTTDELKELAMQAKVTQKKAYKNSTV